MKPRTGYGRYHTPPRVRAQAGGLFRFRFAQSV